MSSPEYARIIVNLSVQSLDRTFEYRIPPALTGKVRVGSRVQVPFGNSSRMVSGYVVELEEEPEFDPARIKDLDSVVEGSLEAHGRMIELAAWMKKNYGGTMNQALKTVLPVKKKVKEKVHRSVSLAVGRDKAMEALSIYDRKKYRARARLIGALLNEESVPCEVLTDKLNVTSRVITALEKEGLVSVRERKIDRNPLSLTGDGTYDTRLSADQQSVCDSIISDFDAGKYGTYLLHGVTGSGKTEVYMELIAHAVAQGKASIMLIPEIALTYQTVMRFYKRFGDRVSFLNSRMSAGERYDQYVRAVSGQLDVIIGPRSALFTPFDKLGFIIVDEEHESTYRSEGVPSYDARAAARELARLSGASVVLGSATPSLESYHAAKSGEYGLFELKERIGGRPLAKTHVVDLRQELKEGNRSAISRALAEGISRRLSRGEQTMLFINRRGVAGFVSCRSCGHVLKCPHCDVSLTEHRGGILMCHYCGHTERVVNRCPSCGSNAIRGFRAGTEKLEQVVKDMFPSASVVRMDADTTAKKGAHEKILSDFADGKADIMIGTQMIVKGHDFPNVTLVGALAADMSLNAPDYRSAERTFQLLTQAAGRAGRSRLPGEFIIQTYRPDHFAIISAAAQDYAPFYEQETAVHELLGYPPYSHMLQMMFSSPSSDQVETAAKTALEAISGGESGDEGTVITGPCDPPMAKLNDIYRKVMYIRDEKRDNLVDIKDVVEALALDSRLGRNVTVKFTFD
ncbi:MAG: primosomal protein N' [Eubacterium sp.]|nr:primosomal protein N' [Eubacterium sp.]